MDDDAEVDAALAEGHGLQAASPAHAAAAAVAGNNVDVGALGRARNEPVVNVMTFRIFSRVKMEKKLRF
jgi:hypothetical protein